VIFSLVILLFAFLLTVGQGRMVLRSMKAGRAGWGRYTYERSSDPVRYRRMIVVEMLLFLTLCVWFARGVSEALP
jgi:hypothetical protein